jgi:hypothetical protein
VFVVGGVQVKVRVLPAGIRNTDNIRAKCIIYPPKEYERVRRSSP